MRKAGTSLHSQTHSVRDASAQISVFGAAPDTGNLGVSALCLSLLGGLWDRMNPADFTVFDHGRGTRAWEVPGAPSGARVRRCGAVATRRIHRAESHARMWAAAACGIGTNAGVERVRSSHAVLDVSGGDSFTDLYGPKRFKSVAFPKRLALELGRPLMLMPQTYGPFKSSEAAAIARSIVCSAERAWARDTRSYGVLQELLGDRFDPRRHGCTVDLAFGLAARRPEHRLPNPIGAWLEDSSVPVAGVNVSGLIANRASASAARFGIVADYRELVSRLVCEMLTSTDARVVLVPHVHAPLGHPESDLDASLEIMRRVPRRFRDRVGVLPTGMTASETKWAIAGMDWLCATRMHACIAGLSSVVPVAGIAYSDKALGVFESCGQGDALIDPRHTDTETALELLLASFRSRGARRARLVDSVKPAMRASEAFFGDLASGFSRPSADEPERVAA